MIEYKQVGEGAPKDVRVITDDRNAELAELDDLATSYDETDAMWYAALSAAAVIEGRAEFIVPGDEVADFADTVSELDDGKLLDLLDEWNAELLQGDG